MDVNRRGFVGFDAGCAGLAVNLPASQRDSRVAAPAGFRFGLGGQYRSGLLPFAGEALGENLPRRRGRSVPDLLLLQIRVPASPLSSLGVLSNLPAGFVHSRAGPLYILLGDHRPRISQRLRPVVAAQEDRCQPVLRGRTFEASPAKR